MRPRSEGWGAIGVGSGRNSARPPTIDVLEPIEEDRRRREPTRRELGILMSASADEDRARPRGSFRVLAGFCCAGQRGSGRSDRAAQETMKKALYKAELQLEKECTPVPRCAAQPGPHRAGRHTPRLA